MANVENILNAAQARQLTALRKTTRTIGQVQNRLATGRRVNSALDNPQNFFAASSLSNRASDLTRILDRIGQNLQVIKTAQNGIAAQLQIIDQAEAFLEEVEKDFLNGAIELGQETDDSLPDNVTLVTPVEVSDFESYAGSQDVSSTITLIPGTGGLNGGDGFTIDGNAWKKIQVDYTVTSDTVLQFEFRSTDQPEIAAIGFDNNNSFNDDPQTFFLYGTQTSGIPYAAPVPTYEYDGSGDWVSVEIPVGTFFTGTFSHLTFVNDDDSGPTGQASYRNMILREGPIPEAETVTTAPAELSDEYSLILEQLDLIALDSSYRGQNLLKSDTMTTFFNEDRTSFLEIDGIEATTGGLGLETEDFTSIEAIRDKIAQVNEARDKLRAFGSSLTNDFNIITTRQVYTNGFINILQEGRDDLTLADQNEEGARLLALQVRQQIQTATIATRTASIADFL